MKFKNIDKKLFLINSYIGTISSLRFNLLPVYSKFLWSAELCSGGIKRGNKFGVRLKCQKICQKNFKVNFHSWNIPKYDDYN